MEFDGESCPRRTFKQDELRRTRVTCRAGVTRRAHRGSPDRLRSIFATMSRTIRLCALFLLAGCGAPGRPPSKAASAPAAEFLVATQDSTYWVRSGDTGVRFRGAPITVALIAGRYYEIFLADDDRSYDDALLVGQRVYRRDLVDGDSALVFEDSVVPRLARQYARAHPSKRPLDPEEEGAENPSTEATAELQLLGVHGPFLSFEYHVDVSLPGADPWHATRRGVLDLRTGHGVAVNDLFPDTVAARVGREGIQQFASFRDSLRSGAGSGDELSERAARLAESLRFDPRSFTLAVVERTPAVEFDIPHRGGVAADEPLPLVPIPAAPTGWWAEARNRYPVGGGDLDAWPRTDEAGYDVLAHYDSVGDVALLSIRDSLSHEWPITTMHGPVLHMFWLDRPTLGASDRRALLRAFDAASLYDEFTRTVRGPSASSARPPRFARLSLTPRHDLAIPTASVENRQAKPARVLRAHDARRREQPRPHLRRGDPLDDGQDGGYRGLQAFTGERRHGVDRSRRLPGADTPRRPGGDEGQRELRGAHVDGSGRPRRS